MTLLTASVTSPSSPCTGFASLVFSTAIVQPGSGFVFTDAIGCLAGKSISTATVLAFGSSLGTEKLTISEPPFGADPGTTSTWAPAADAPSAITDPIRMLPTSTRRPRRLIFIAPTPRVDDVEG